MKVDRITAQIRFSQDTGHGAWKSIEIGAEASVDGKETWTEDQARLYQQLGQQLKVLWANGNGNKTPESPGNGSESTVAAPQPVEQPSVNPTARITTASSTAYPSGNTPVGLAGGGRTRTAPSGAARSRLRQAV